MSLRRISCFDNKCSISYLGPSSQVESELLAVDCQLAKSDLPLSSCSHTRTLFSFPTQQLFTTKLPGPSYGFLKLELFYTYSHNKFRSQIVKQHQIQTQHLLRENSWVLICD
ncbi:hypothetical protein EPI10_016525 [Gossypium australe]|uniref:Uncharacterized protein n=1 Tax=Gossypium australe TaxID=47621 RepID=A0A5B6VP72_9ROSI|nr:hypothetical protein EPI10_016525 [Gossypium australe]